MSVILGKEKHKIYRMTCKRTKSGRKFEIVNLIHDFWFGTHLKSRKVIPATPARNENDDCENTQCFKC
ncbi:Hypothetical predicted protein [Octopus vulgaris]|uniref:Uncharacterized protein n=1 Tax=Octopus vulgaris TaxID=6645 RepID=A0AA36BB21_OCTVU|nr:Hypothetical predicted protein [Octopus vulgaris]